MTESPDNVSLHGALAGVNIALVHPAWHSCGSYRSFAGQIAAYRALGARVSAIAIADAPGFTPDRRWLWRSYVKATPELNEAKRHFGGAPLRSVCAPRFLREALWPYLHGDLAAMRVAIAERAKLADGVEDQRYDLVHCNHFFLMPIASRLARERAPVLLDTHDLQARQFELINRRRACLLEPRARFETMLQREIAQMARATALMHVNQEELEFFAARLPDRSHALLYPATPAPPIGPGGPDVILVASNNVANVESVVWFLREVAPKAPDVAVKIVGNVDAGVRAQAPDAFGTFKNWFAGRVDDPGLYYASARLALLPTVSGTGLSIKTVEALASGLPLVATTRAFRGMNAEAITLPGVAIADSAEDFARAIREAAARQIPGTADPRQSATREYYGKYFSLAAYRRNLAAIALPLLDKRCGD